MTMNTNDLKALVKTFKGAFASNKWEKAGRVALEFGFARIARRDFTLDQLVTVSTPIPDCGAAFECAGHSFTAVAGKLPKSAPVVFADGAINGLTVKPGDELVYPVRGENVCTFPVRADLLLAGLVKVAPAMSSDKFRGELTGVRVESMPTGSAVELVATDGHRMHVSAVDSPEGGGLNIAATMPARLVDVLLTWLPTLGHEIVDLMPEDGAPGFTVRNGVTTVRGLFMGGAYSYPDWRGVIPEWNSARQWSPLDVSNLAGAVKTVKPRLSGHGVTVCLADGSVASEAGTAECYAGPFDAFRVNAAYMLDALAMFKHCTSSVRIHGDPGKATPITIRDLSGNNTCVVMPIR